MRSSTVHRPTTGLVRSAAALRSRIRGAVYLPGDPAYGAARAAWNRSAQHQPALVVLPETTDDVAAAVRRAGADGLGVGVQATGHGTGRPCVGGVLVNTSRMRGLEVDPVGRRARVAAGVTWAELVPAAAAHGLAGLPGSSTTVGVVGYTLGGGFGWLGRRYGLAAHSVRGAEVVTADGRVLHTGPDRHPDLFWGLLGGGGSLGVVTSLEFDLHPVREVYAGNLYYPLSRAQDLLTFMAGWSRTVPDELTAAATFRSFPPLATVPEPLRGRSLVAVRGCFCGDPTAGARLLDRARAALGPALLDTFRVLPAADLASVSLDPVEPLAVLNHSEMLPDLTPETVAALVDVAGPDSGSPLVMVEARQLGGALAGPSGTLSPMAHTRARFSLNAIGVTPTPEHTDRVRAHLDLLRRRLVGHTTGETYLNFLDLDGAGPDRVRAAYTAADWHRLTALKATYDPDNLFRFTRHPEPTPTVRTRTQP